MDQLYEDVVRHDYRDLLAVSFRRVTVRQHQKGLVVDAWIHMDSSPAVTADVPREGAEAAMSVKRR